MWEISRYNFIIRAAEFGGLLRRRYWSIGHWFAMVLSTSARLKQTREGEKKEEGETKSRQKQHCRFVSDLWLATRARTCTYICGYSICHHLLRKRITSKSCSAPLPPKIKVGQKKLAADRSCLCSRCSWHPPASSSIARSAFNFTYQTVGYW